MIKLFIFIIIFVGIINFNKAEECHNLLIKIINPGYPDYDYFYKINWEMVVRKIQGFDAKFKHQTSTKILGYFDGEPIYKIDLKGIGNKKRKKVIILSGVHGNESIGVNISLDFIEEFVNNKSMRENFDFVFFPMVNPYGVKNNIRQTATGMDLNRSFIEGKEVKTDLLIKESLQGENIDLILDLHEAVSQKRFFIVRNRDADDVFIDTVIEKIPDKFKLLSSTGKYPEPLYSVKDNKEISYILDSPAEAVSINTGTVKDYFHDVFKVKHSYSIECPKSMDLIEKKEIYKHILKLFLSGLLPQS